uniref:Uncharacterized protein n=1 Tax=Arundo donax TaxID=35708 RepID=A0A0A9BBH7_ARUDO
MSSAKELKKLLLPSFIGRWKLTKNYNQQICENK